MTFHYMKKRGEMLVTWAEGNHSFSYPLWADWSVARIQNYLRELREYLNAGR